MKNPTSFVWHWPLAIRLAAVFVGVVSAQAAAAPRPHVWLRWEHSLTSARQHDNPYPNVTFRIRYSGPDGRRLDSYGFWDGGQVFRIRCAFPAPGLWHWETECSDAHHAIEWILHAYRHEPHKPVINLEAMYDGQGSNGWQAVDARSLAWRSWLSGAKGYTYGAGDTPPKCPQGSGGVWRWVTDREKPDFWEKAIGWESSFQMKYLHDFLAAIEWWKLAPAHELVRHQPDEITRRMVLARIPGRDFGVAYLPDNDEIDVNLSAFSAPVAARWFDPVRGRNSPVTGRIPNQGDRRFVPPAKGDWLLVIERAAEGVGSPKTQSR